ncbi:MAG: 2-octaprenyl-3-methyl-6-methoxy-1,4-benzoquinol hydroxylase [Gammaproteobacteria bacterium]|nr:MAG: 2-octaprenyl-3-methyl-6-methoxy-1,4-benzoquinol hydroxylase [Gammaproteobacteria bacterium]
MAGAGIVGGTLACALGNQPLRIALVETKPPVLHWPIGARDLRVSAVTLGSARLFQALGVWDDLCAQGVSPFYDMHVWDAAGPGEIHFDAAGIGEETLGYIVENRCIQAALMRRIEQCANVVWCCPASVEALELDGDHILLGAKQSERLKTRLAVGADGADSALRRLAGIGAQAEEYGECAVVANVKTSRSHQRTAWQRFLPGGPLAFLPLPDERESSIVWTMPAERAQNLLALDEPGFIAELQTALGDKIPRQGLGRVEAAGPRAGFPLRRVHAESYIAQRLALIGDAAHTVHPLAGQGVNLGLGDAAVLAETLLRAHAEGKDIGARSVLRRYERARKGEVLAMMAALQGLHRLFGSQHASLRWARNLGLDMTDALTPVKNLIMRHAVGGGSHRSA